MAHQQPSLLQNSNHANYASIDITSVDDASASTKNQSICAERIGNTANTMSVLLAAAIFSIPWAFFEAGIAGGFVIITFASGISCSTILSLLKAQRDLYFECGEVFDYPDLASRYLGSSYWGSTVRTATTISCVGGCAGFFVFIGQICSQELELPLEQTIALLCIPMILMSWIRSFKELSIFTAFGVFSIVFSVIAILIEGFPVQRSSLVIRIFDPIQSFGFIGNATFLFTVHYCILSMGAEVLQNHKFNNYHHTALPLTQYESTRFANQLTCPVITAFLCSTIVVAGLGLVGPLVYSGNELVRCLPCRVSSSFPFDHTLAPIPQDCTYPNHMYCYIH
jgi:hypothetical protein